MLALRMHRILYETGLQDFLSRYGSTNTITKSKQHALPVWSHTPLSFRRPLILSHCQYTASEQILIVILNKRIQIECRDATHNPRDLPGFCSPSARFLFSGKVLVVRVISAKILLVVTFPFSSFFYFIMNDFKFRKLFLFLRRYKR